MKKYTLKDLEKLVMYGNNSPTPLAEIILGLLNASGGAEGLGTKVTTLEGEVTKLKGQVSGYQTTISNLQTKVTELEQKVNTNHPE